MKMLKLEKMMVKNKIFLWGALLLCNSILQNVCAAQLQNNFAAVFLNWPVSFAQPQFQMEVDPGKAVEGYYTSFTSTNPLDFNTSFGSYTTYVFGTTSTQTQGYYSALLGSTAQSQLVFARPNLGTTVSNPGYVNGEVVGWADILFTARIAMRQWMEGLNWTGPLTPAQAVATQNTVSLNLASLSFSSFLWPQVTFYYNWKATGIGPGHLDYGNYNYITLLWFNSLPLSSSTLNVGANGGSLVPGNPLDVVRTVVNPQDIAQWQQTYPAQAYGMNFTPSTYPFPGYWNYYTNSDTPAFTTLYETVTSSYGVPEYFSEATFLPYLQLIQNQYLTSQLNATTGFYTNTCAAAYNLLNDPEKPSTTITPENFATFLPGLETNSSTHEFFLNFLVNNSSNTKAALVEVSESLLSYTPLYNVSGSTSTVAGLSSGNIYYLPIFLSDPGLPYVPVALNYATETTEFEPLKSLQSDFTNQLGAIKSMAPVGA